MAGGSESWLSVQDSKAKCSLCKCTWSIQNGSLEQHGRGINHNRNLASHYHYNTRPGEHKRVVSIFEQAEEPLEWKHSNGQKKRQRRGQKQQRVSQKVAEELSANLIKEMVSNAGANISQRMRCQLSPSNMKQGWPHTTGEVRTANEMINLAGEIAMGGRVPSPVSLNLDKHPCHGLEESARLVAATKALVQQMKLRTEKGERAGLVQKGAHVKVRLTPTVPGAMLSPEHEPAQEAKKQVYAKLAPLLSKGVREGAIREVTLRSGGDDTATDELKEALRIQFHRVVDEQIVSFLLCTHRRCGGQSKWNSLPSDVAICIASMLRSDLPIRVEGD